MLLEGQAAHGYELIKTIEERSGGFYSPSPGMIYPALTFLEEVGYAQSEHESTRKLYRITSEGRSHLSDHRVTADAILDALTRIGRRMDDVRDAFAGVGEVDGWGVRRASSSASQAKTRASSQARLPCQRGASHRQDS